MARQTDQQPVSARKSSGVPLNVSLPPDLVRMLKVVSAHRDETITKFVEDALRPVVTREYRKLGAVIQHDVGGEG
jgi:hypothetical protein